MSEKKIVEEKIAKNLQGENIYRTLFNSMDEGFCIIEVLFDDTNKPYDYRFLETNASFENQTGLLNAAGKTIKQMTPRYEQHLFDLYGRVAKTGEPIRFENEVKETQLYYEVYVFRIGKEDENRIAVLFNNITERKRHALNTAFLAEISVDLTALSANSDALSVIGPKIGTHFNVERCIFAKIDEEKRAAIILYDWHKDELPHTADDKIYDLRNFITDEFYTDVHAGKTIVVNDTVTDERTNHETPTQLNTHAFITCSSISHGKWEFLLCISDSKPRNWRADEIELTKEVTDRIWTRIETAKAEEALKETTEALAQDLKNTQLLHCLSERFVSESDLHVFYHEIINTAIAITNANAGTVQLLDEETNELVLLASKNIHKNVTNRFKRISSSSTMSCGHALLLKKRTFIDYANPDAPDLDGALKAHVDAGLLSAQSTPLITREGKLIGMVTTHWKQRHFKPTERQLQYLDLLARQAADLLERKQHSEKYLLQLENDVRLRTAEIDKQKQLFEAVINSTPDLVGAYDTEKRILIFNKSCEKLFNTKCEEVIGKKYHEVFPQGKNTQADRDLDRVLQGETVHNKLFHSIVSGRDYENYLVPLRDENGKVYAAVTIAQDITENNLRAKELEATNNELQKMNKELEAFTYASSHDLQEPLRKIRIFAGRIMDADQDKLSEKSKGYFVYIQEAVERMQTLISDLLSFSHLASTERKYEMTDLGSIIREIKKEFKETIEAKNAIIETQNLCRVNVIRFQFRQLLHNLVSNALKFTKPDTPAHIIIRCKKTKLLPSPPFTGQEGVIISISDNGIGFEPHYSERVFEMFQKLHSKDEYAGTGLGLAIVKKIVENHHGCITVDSQPDKGTTFNIYLAG